MARTRFVVVLIGQLLLCVRYIDLTIEIAYPKRRVAGRKNWISEREAGGWLKVFVVGLDLTGMKIRHVEKVVTIGHAQGSAFVNCASSSVILRWDGVSAIEI